MKKTFISFPHIDQYRTVIKGLILHFQYVGKDADGNPIYDSSKELPKLKFHGTVKIHGTNSGITWSPNEVDKLYPQKRSSNCSVESDNAGFAFFVESNREYLLKLFKLITLNNPGYESYTLYGEWAGEKIQNGVGISKLPKSFYIFGLKGTNGEVGTWLNHNLYCGDPELRIYNIEDFKTFEIEVDLNRPELVQNDIVKMVEEVEAECPVAKKLGVEGIGEGIVFVTLVDGEKHQFKAKGEKHSASKVKTIASVNVDKINSIIEFANYAVTENRLNQGIEQVFTVNGEAPSKQKTGDFVRWVMNDVLREEVDTLKENNLEPKDIGKEVSKRASKWFIDKVESF